MVEHNLHSNVDKMEAELDSVSKRVKHMIWQCDSQLNDEIEELRKKLQES